MKQSYRFLFVAFLLSGILLSACGAAAVPGAQKVAADIIITGTLESMEGTQWVVNGQTITVDPSVIKDGPFVVGDFVKVEGVIRPDGAFVVTRIETPTADDLSSATDPAVDNGNANTNDANSNDANTNDTNSNDSNTNDANSNDDNSNDDNSNDASTNDDDNGNDDDSNASNINDDNGNDNSSNDDDSNDNSSGDDNRDDGNDNSNGDDDSDGDNSGDDNSNNS